MTMIINNRVETINAVKIITFEIDADAKDIFISYRFGRKDGAGFEHLGNGNLNLKKNGFDQFMDWIPNGTDNLKTQLLPLLYKRIAADLGESPGPIDI